MYCRHSLPFASPPWLAHAKVPKNPQVARLNMLLDQARATQRHLKPPRPQTFLSWIRPGTIMTCMFNLLPSLSSRCALFRSFATSASMADNCIFVTIALGQFVMIVSPSHPPTSTSPPWNSCARHAMKAYSRHRPACLIMLVPHSTPFLIAPHHSTSHTGVLRFSQTSCVRNSTRT